MPLSTVLILGFIVAFFSAFVVGIGAVWVVQVIDELRAQAAARRGARPAPQTGAFGAARG